MFSSDRLDNSVILISEKEQLETKVADLENKVEITVVVIGITIGSSGKVSSGKIIKLLCCKFHKFVIIFFYKTFNESRKFI